MACPSTDVGGGTGCVQGLGQTYRYFRNRRTDYAAEMDQSTYESEEES